MPGRRSLNETTYQAVAPKLPGEVRYLEFSKNFPQDPFWPVRDCRGLPLWGANA
jgi:hypothetical protein